MLIASTRHTASDLLLWREYEDADLVWAKGCRYRRVLAEALEAIARFTTRPCYAGVSWGKDSTVLAHLVYLTAPAVPLCWVRVEPIKSPDCELVRDAFLSQHPAANYHEVEVWCQRDAFGWHAKGTLETGVAECVRKFGDRRLLGIRASESTQRGFRIWRHGLATEKSCDPLGRWGVADVMAHLATCGLPVHPAYGCLGGGRWPRDALRVSSLGGRRGDGLGRSEWEAEYYGVELRRLEANKGN